MEEDGLREAAIETAASSLRSNLKPKSGITSSQLSKFQELHQRRLKIKSKSKVKNKTKGLHDGNKKFEETEVITENCKNEESTFRNEDSNAFAGSTSSRQHGEVEARLLTTGKRPKLRWGLDTKERWEMKANM